MTVNIYIYQTIKGPKAHKGAYTFIIEAVFGEKAATLSKIGTLEPMTENQAELFTLLEAYKRMKKSSQIRLVGVNGYIRLGIEQWMPKWAENNWETAKGIPIANAEQWQQLYKYIQKYPTEVILEQEHSYKDWMMKEAQKAVPIGE